MKNEKIYDAISDIREEFIEEAENYKFKKRMVPRVIKWGSMACAVSFFAHFITRMSQNVGLTWRSICCMIVFKVCFAKNHHR